MFNPDQWIYLLHFYSTKLANKSTKKWKCKICGYVYEGDELPEDFVCPICGRPHTEFYEMD